MADVLGYVLSKKDMELLKRVIKTFDRMQHYSNAFGREPEDKLDHEEFHTTEVYIARTPNAGIPALMSAGSTGIGDTPGSADCVLFKKGRSATTTDTLFASLTKTIYNLSEFAIPGDTWVVVVRDKHGTWFAVQAGQPDTSGGGGGGSITGPGWIAGLSNEDCLKATVFDQTGVCSTVPTQILTLTSPTGVTWTSTDDFIYSGGSGKIVLTRPCNESMPKITINGFCGIFEKAGLLNTGDSSTCYADFKFGTDLCSDVPGTGSGTGGARGACCGNTFTVRIQCTPCVVLTDCNSFELDFPVVYRVEWFEQTSGFSVFYGAFNITYSPSLSTPPTVLIWDGHGIINTQNLSPGCNCGPKNVRFQLKITNGVACTVQFRMSCNNGAGWVGWTDIVGGDEGDYSTQVSELQTPPATDGLVHGFDDPGLTMDGGSNGCTNCCAISFIIGHV